MLIHQTDLVDGPFPVELLKPFGQCQRFLMGRGIADLIALPDFQSGCGDQILAPASADDDIVFFVTVLEGKF